MFDLLMSMEKEKSDGSTLHIAMYPWFAFGHFIPYMDLSNKLAEKGHTISFIIPPTTISKVEHLNRFPKLITFYPITYPNVEGLPLGAETTNDVPVSSLHLISTAMDKTQNEIEFLLRKLKPHFILYNFAYWVSKLARPLGIKSMHYTNASAAATAYNVSSATHHNLKEMKKITEAELMKPPRGYPDSSIHLHFHEARDHLMMRNVKPGAINMFDRLYMSLAECDIIGIKTCREIDGLFIDFLEKDFGKPILLTGSLPDPPTNPLEKKWLDFLGQFKPNSVIYCCLGSESILTKSQFQELALGLELSGFPFLAALRTPSGADSIEEALPDGFQERIGERGVIHGGWIQQPQILNHPSIGCFITHCGGGSFSEALVAKSKCVLVLLPNRGDQIFYARILEKTFKAGIEVEKSEEEGLFTIEGVFKAIKTAMEDDNEVGKEVRANLAKLRQPILSDNFQSSYFDDFVNKLKALAFGMK
ncbi:hypothetical protein G4B88_016254 [Cannabis sativa]|uniref:Glycosyltransferase n=1 Tax=Cannabis sativa TaxID=3483 RepID=A0A7J6DKS8_CANSA|nr:hypothetical protein G4B88_016254 [Cannabis sativa]